MHCNLRSLVALVVSGFYYEARDATAYNSSTISQTTWTQSTWAYRFQQDLTIRGKFAMVAQISWPVSRNNLPGPCSQSWISDIPVLLCFKTRVSQRRLRWSKIGDQFLHFLPSRKLGEGWAKCRSQFSKLSPEPNLSWYFWRSQLRELGN